MVFGKQALQGYESNRRHADGVRGEHIPRNHDVGPLEKIQSPMRDLQYEPEHFNDRIIFMSMYNDIEWGAKGNKDVSTKNRQWRIMLADCLAVIGLSWGLDQKRSGTELTLTDQTDHGINHHETISRLWSPNISCLQCLWERRISKQRRGKEVYALQR